MELSALEIGLDYVQIDIRADASWPTWEFCFLWTIDMGYYCCNLLSMEGLEFRLRWKTIAIFIFKRKFWTIVHYTYKNDSAGSLCVDN